MPAPLIATLMQSGFRKYPAPADSGTGINPNTIKGAPGRSLVRSDHVRVIGGPQHGRHDQIADRGPIAIEVGLLAQHSESWDKRLRTNYSAPGRQVGPFLVGVEYVHQYRFQLYAAV